MEFFNNEIFEWLDDTDDYLVAASDAYELSLLQDLSASSSGAPSQLFSAPPSTLGAGAGALVPGTSSTHTHNHSSPTLLSAVRPFHGQLSDSPSRFAPPKTSQEVHVIEAREAGIPAKTKADTRYCFRVWEEWREHRAKLTTPPVPPLLAMTDSEMSHWLTQFILEARKMNGEQYPPNSLHHIVAGLMRHIRQSVRAIDCFKDQVFRQFRLSLDAELKRLQSEGL